MSSKLFSIVIITRNRSETIRHTLESVQSIDLPTAEYEVVIVDNGSTDGTSETVRAKMSGSGVSFKIVIEPVAGMCRARNTGIANAAGEWILFLDDDALVPPNWLSAYQHAIQQYPEAAVFGGPATLDVRLVRPWWWTSRFDVSMSCQDYGPEMMPYKPYTHPYGLNMVFRKSVLEKYNGFDVTLDTIVPGLADETDLFFRMQGNTELLVYVPDARVIHSVLPDRLTWPAFRNRCIHVGQTFACLEFRHKIRINRSLPRRLLSAAYHCVSQPAPALFLKEFYEWYGYRKFKRKYKHAFPASG